MNVSVSIIGISNMSSLTLGSATEGCMLWAPHTLRTTSRIRRRRERPRDRREEVPNSILIE